MHRQCAFRSATGKPCRAAPLREGESCRMHSPERIKEVQEGRRLGGLRRRRESTISSAYQFKSLNTVNGIGRIVEIALLDTLGMENSIARNRTLAYLVQVALHTLEVGDMEQRLSVLENKLLSGGNNGDKKPN